MSRFSFDSCNYMRRCQCIRGWCSSRTLFCQPLEPTVSWRYWWCRTCWFMNDSFWCMLNVSLLQDAFFCMRVNLKHHDTFSTPQSSKGAMTLLGLCGFLGSFRGAVMGEHSCPSALWGREGVKVLALYSLLAVGEWGYFSSKNILHWYTFSVSVYVPKM